MFINNTQGYGVTLLIYHHINKTLRIVYSPDTKVRIGKIKNKKF
jgi:hypothetical protein